MEIATYVLVVRDKNGHFQLAQERNNSKDLAVGFEEKYADFMFEFAESRIHCRKNQEIFLLKGRLNTEDIAQQQDFTSAFKAMIKAPRDYSGWELVRSKRALSVTDDHYRERLMKHLRARHRTVEETAPAQSGSHRVA